ncbi:MAG TPA: carboxyl transferase domain-containing protein [Thermoanaerobaculia bacterium]|nr:carboxyl transferase domain-containing protein [Thermoanaerobaculia bacterium]
MNEPRARGCGSGRAITKLLVANRGEIAIRILRAASELGLRTVSVHAEDDAASLHTRWGGESVALAGTGARAYLDVERIVAIALDRGCDAIHPGYGFLSENADFAEACAQAAVRFVGPRPEILRLFGDKARAREAAIAAGVQVIAGTRGGSTLEEVTAFFDGLGHGAEIMLKAVAGGGGRGMRAVRRRADLAEAFERCRSEATAAFGSGELYAEELWLEARHVEVQILADGVSVSHAGERDCSVQRRHQKLIEIAPAPGLSAELRDQLCAAAVSLAEAVRYDSVGTIEFLVASGADDGAGSGRGEYHALRPQDRFAFIEANPRLQVEHTVTEEVTGVDLVATQIELAAGRSLAELGLLQSQVAAPRGTAIELRINMERMTGDGGAVPGGGTLTVYEPPSGPGIRVDGFGYAGYTTSARYDSLLAKLVVRAAGGFDDARARAYTALCAFRIAGVPTNLGFLANLLRHPRVERGDLYTRLVDDHIAELVAGASHPRLFFDQDGDHDDESNPGRAHAGARVDPSDPLAVLTYGKSQRSERSGRGTPAIDGAAVVRAPLQGTIVAIAVAEGDPVRRGQSVLIMESMKMEHEVRATVAGVVRRVAIEQGDTVYEGHPLLFVEEGEVAVEDSEIESDVDLDRIRPDLDEVLARRAKTLDASRPEAVARRRAKQQRTARENVLDLCDPGTFVEYGPLVLAAQRRRRSLQDLIDRTPADGMITGVGAINGALFGDPASRCAVMAYDYTVLAGTQGQQNHRKTDRLIDVAESGRMPLVLFAEGGGGRPGDTDGMGSGQRTFARFAQLSALVPMVGITSGRCFAGNASLLGCCDVIIATASSSIGMGGPAMIEGGGLGVFAPEEIGPMEVQVPNGVVDLAVEDEAEAVAVARRYLSYFQGTLSEWTVPDQRRMRGIVPENRLRGYPVREVIDTLADEGTVLELRPRFGIGIVTSLVRVEGRPLGVIANNPMHLGGAIDSDGADKAARFMQLCDAFDLPILYLCDTPGIMVGPEIEHTALLRHSSRMFLVGANLEVPFFTIVLRKSYGLGGIAMAGGSFKTPYFSVAWPTGEFGGMGLEGSVKLGYRNELEAIEDPAERMKRYQEMVAAAYENGKALNQASLFHIDDTIDPAESRFWVANLLRSIRPPPPRAGKRRPVIDAW